MGLSQTGEPNAGGGGKNQQISINISLYLRNSSGAKTLLQEL